MSQSKSRRAPLFSTLFPILLVLIAFLSFIALGFWQLDRAAQVKELQKPYEEQPLIALSKVAKPNSNLDGASVNRIVEFSGSYVAQFDAPNQIDKKGVRGTWLV
ncbi:MAG: SURF1 family cytochrome oxidase biogenesis protein, partial [Actinomycetota bacterium]